jgi:hypothetical protein
VQRATVATFRDGGKVLFALTLAPRRSQRFAAHEVDARFWELCAVLLSVLRHATGQHL